MDTVLITGSAGQVGRGVVRRLAGDGWTVRGLDLADGDDLRDAAAVAAAVAGCDAVVHAGALAHDSAGSPEDIVATNLLGTWHVLLAAERHGPSRVVYFSSAQVFGCAEGEGAPDYLPIDDAHPLRAARPYGMSKRLAEEMCAAWTARTGIPTIVLRPVMIVTGDHHDPAIATVHVDDVVDATVRALAAEIDGHARMIISGRGGFDISVARRLLGWRPLHADADS